MQDAECSPRDFWDQRYGETELAYGAAANDFLREQAKGLPLGEALCLAEGQGRNAVHLAQLGHRAVAQDLSPVGLQRAVALAEQRGVRLQTLCCDLGDWNPEASSTDLIVAIWMHLPPGLRAQVLRRAVMALRPGGQLILEAYTPEQLALGTGGPPNLELLVEPDSLRQELDGLELTVFNACQRWIQEGPYHWGDSAVVQVRGIKHLPDA